MFKNIFNYQPAEDKAEAIEQFLEDQPTSTTLLTGATVAAVTYLAGFAVSRLLRSAETRVQEYRFDTATVKAAVEAATSELS